MQSVHTRDWRRMKPVGLLLEVLVTFTVVVAQEPQLCSLNGHHVEGKGCVCDPGWRGDRCAELDIPPASPKAFGFYDKKVPSWGGGAVFSEVRSHKGIIEHILDPNKKFQGRWHLIVGSRAQDVPLPDDSGTDYTKTDYPCDSRIVRAISAGTDPAGPYKLAEVWVK